MISRVLLYLLMITCMLILVSSKEVKWTVRDASPKLGQDLTLFCKVDNCTVNEIIKGWRGGPDDKILMANSGISTDKTKYNTSIDEHGFILTILNLTVKDLNVSYECSCGFNIDKHILYIEDLYKVDNLNKSTNGTNYVGIKDADDIYLYIVIPSILVIVLIIVIVVIKRYWLWGRLPEHNTNKAFVGFEDAFVSVNCRPRYYTPERRGLLETNSNKSDSSFQTSNNHKDFSTSTLPGKRHMEYANIILREKSFKTWPLKKSTLVQLTEEGFCHSVGSNRKESRNSFYSVGSKVSYLHPVSEDRSTISLESQSSTASYHSVGSKVSYLHPVSEYRSITSLGSQSSTASYYSVGSKVSNSIRFCNRKESRNSLHSVGSKVSNSSRFFNRKESRNSLHSVGSKVSNSTRFISRKESRNSLHSVGSKVSYLHPVSEDRSITSLGIKSSTASYYSAVESLAPSTCREIRNEIGEGKTDRSETIVNKTGY